MIWKRWVEEYLPQNKVRTQWNEQKANVEVGGKQFEKVSLQNHDGTFKRPVEKLAPVFNERFWTENGASTVGAPKKD